MKKIVIAKFLFENRSRFAADRLRPRRNRRLQTPTICDGRNIADNGLRNDRKKMLSNNAILTVRRPGIKRSANWAV